MRTLAQAKYLATCKGLSVDKYNPGDNLTYKVDQGVNKSYFAMSWSAVRFKSLKAAMEYIENYKGNGE